MPSESRKIAILTGPDTYLDHVGVLSQILQIPLIVTEEETYLSAKEFYPGLDVHYREMADLSLHFLAENFDVIFQSGKFWNIELKALIELLYRKTLRFVFCPHGNSDKGFSLTNHTPQDLSLVYGEHMLSLLKNTGALDLISQTCATGNYRLPFYTKHKEFYDGLAKKRLGNKLNATRKTILYAPTWQDGENPSSFFSSCEKIIGALEGDYNLIIKLHPFLEQFHPAETFAVLSQFEDRQGTIFLTKFPAIYPILSLSDIYIGDFSSIGYDFLAFDKPLFFLGDVSKKTTPGYFLHECGIQIPQEENLDLKAFLLTTLSECENAYRAKRKEIYEYAFGKKKNFEVLREEIFNCLDSDIVVKPKESLGFTKNIN
ncbi:MAG: CDP-glycerol glycerophosphotransferase family protein [Chlamydiae bacterium]|nr:CDP-glycerol glycerophosphotransferase family protein [Chlamydiota bacterium]